jgi:hypothetical protein
MNFALLLIKSMIIDNYLFQVKLRSLQSLGCCFRPTASLVQAALAAMKLDPVWQRAYFVNLATAWLINKTMN